MTITFSRRKFMTGAAGAAAALATHDTASPMQIEAGAGLGPPEDFSFGSLLELAKRRAASPFSPSISSAPNILSKIDYDEYQRIHFRTARTFFLGSSDQYPIQLFHLGKYAKEPVGISIVSADGSAREIVYRSDLFDIPPDHPALQLPVGIGFAGFRIMGSDLKRDWFSAIGASYFRSSGPFDQYGLSARAIAIDTATQKPEEFPRFVQFWLLGPAVRDQPLEIYALVDGPSLTGALRITACRMSDSRGAHRVANDIEAHFFVRRDIERVGIAPLSSMYWYGEAPRKLPSDWRPEIHDSDGLAVWTGNGERLWRPLLNPPRVMTNSFVDRDVKGFGLVQRDRDFDHYLDDGAFYERRPSVWIEPADKWSEGSVQLIEMPTGEETWDNIVTYWAPKAPWKAGESKVCKYRLSWLDAIAYPGTLARVIGTWSGFGGPPGLSYKERDPNTRKFVIDFESNQFMGVGRDDGIELVVSASRGTIAAVASYPVVSQQQRWRGMFDLTADGGDPIDLRAYLRKGNSALSETWIYQHFPGAYF